MGAVPFLDPAFPVELAMRLKGKERMRGVLKRNKEAPKDMMSYSPFFILVPGLFKKGGARGREKKAGGFDTGMGKKGRA